MFKHKTLLKFLTVCAIMLGLFVGGQVGVNAQSSTGTPILLVVNDNGPSPFGRYLGEILLAEGISSFDVIDIGSLSASAIADRQLVILGQTALSGAQATILSDYVSAGGNLMAMRPDSQLASLFELGSAAGTLNGGYMRIDASATLNAAAPGAGLVTETLQLHTAADQYNTLAGAVTIAQLYSNATSATTYPAVVSNTDGSAVAFTYDLATNVILTRQGNPANGSVDTDGDTVLRTIDLFQDAGGGAPWVDLNKIHIPQADEQQRLFARLVRQAVEKTLPLPQMWYFPDGALSMMIPTSDAHANPVNYFQSLMDTVNNAGGRITVYLTAWGGLELTLSDLQTWMAQGHEFGIHPYGNPQPTNYQQLYAGYVEADAWFRTRYNFVPSPTVRNHQVTWVGWTDAAEVAINNGMGLDANFYHWGDWLQKPDGSWPHGYVTGSGQSMKFVRADGTILPYYQQLTQLVDEQFFSITGAGYENLTPAQANVISENLIDASLNGDYAAIMTQFHVDYSSWGEVQPWVAGTLNYASANGVPIWTAGDWLDFVETRYALSYENMAWDDASGTLTFTMNGPTNNGFSVSTMIPVNYDGRGLLSVSVDGAPVDFYYQTIKGQNMAFVNIGAGNHSFTVVYDGPQVTVTPSGPPTATPTLTPTTTLTPSITPTPSPTLTPSETPTGTLTATPTEPPSADVLDDFNRANGAIGSNWTGATGGFAITNNQLDVTGGGDIYWGTTTFGADQEVWVTLVNIDPSATEIDLILKSQSNATWGSGLLEVLYDPGQGSLQVWTFDQANSWVNHGSFNVALVNGDRLGARALPDGTVEVYVNNSLIGTADASSWPFSVSGGYIGLWMIGGSATILEDFDGGDFAGLPTPTPTNTPTDEPTATNTPTETLTPTEGPSPTATATATNTPTETPTNTPTATFTPSSTPLPTNTPTNTPTPVPACFVDQTAADFGAGSFDSGAFLSQIGDGAVSLAPTLEETFSGGGLPAGWSGPVWAPSGSVVITGGQMVVTDARAGTDTDYTPQRAIEFVATFGNGAWQHVGLDADLSFNFDWAMFSTFSGGGNLYARTSNGQVTNLGAGYIGAPHTYRVETRSDATLFFIDGVLVATHGGTLTGYNLRPIASDGGGDGVSLLVDWMRLSPNTTSGTFTSRVYDAGAAQTWQQLFWNDAVPASAGLTVSVRAGNTSTPDATWTNFVNISNGASVNTTSRYIQYRVSLSTSDTTTSPMFYDLGIRCVAASPFNQSPLVEASQGTFTGDESGITAAGTVSDPDGDVVILSASIGSIVNNGDGTWTWTYTAPDGPAEEIVTVTGSDGRGGSSQTVFIASIANSAPTAVFANTSGTISAGDSATLAFSYPQDSSADTAAGFTYSYACSNTEPFVVVQGTITAFNCPYPDAGTFTALGRIHDQDGAYTEYQATVEVLPAEVPTNTPTPTDEPTSTPTDVPTSTPTDVPTSTPTDVPTSTPLPTNTPTNTPTPMPAACFVDQTAADFGAGSFGSGTYLSQIGDGAVSLAPTLEETFSGSGLPAGWSGPVWAPSGSVNVTGGQMVVTDARAGTDTAYTPQRAIEFVATFGNGAWQHAGLEANLSFEYDWAIFSTFSGGGNLYARTSNGQVTNLGGSYIGTPHTYRVETRNDATLFFIDGALVATHGGTLTGYTLRPIASDGGGDGVSLLIDWMRLSPNATSGTFTSRVFDGGSNTNWTEVNWNGTTPVGTSLTVSVRAGDTPAPDGTWTSFVNVADGGLANLTGRYVQYQVSLNSSDAGTSPMLYDLLIDCASAPASQQANLIQVEPNAAPTSAPVQPTNTPTLEITATPLPTDEPTATAVPPTETLLPTDEPTATAVPPTETPLPTNTPVPPTETPLPTATVVPPTETPMPTNTPVPPTQTPLPTATTDPGSQG